MLLSRLGSIFKLKNPWRLQQISSSSFIWISSAVFSTFSLFIFSFFKYSMLIELKKITKLQTEMGKFLQFSRNCQKDLWNHWINGRVKQKIVAVFQIAETEFCVDLSAEALTILHVSLNNRLSSHSIKRLISQSVSLNAKIDPISLQSLWFNFLQFQSLFFFKFWSTEAASIHYFCQWLI